ncbi:AVE protein, partial [Furnarius figulus]|nr:AVE protein [Furnarius figulus]
MEPWGQDGAEAPLEGCPETECPAGQWSVPEVCSWLGAHGGLAQLAQLAQAHALTGRALLRLTEGSLRRLGVTPRGRRREMLRELLRLRLQQEILELWSIAGLGEHGWG